MANIKFYTTEYLSGNNSLIPHEQGSGLGFYGAGYGVSVPIGGKQDTTWLTNSDGTSSVRTQLHNTKHVSATGVSINGASAIALDKLPNNKCPLNIRFEHTEAVRVQNCKLRIFDRNNIANHASGVSTFVFEARHPSTDQAISNLNQRGRSENTWYEFDPVEAMSDMPLTNSPGISGVNTNTNDNNVALGYVTRDGVSHTSTRHDFYVATSVEPAQIGNRLFGLYVSLEYL